MKRLYLLVGTPNKGLSWSIPCRSIPCASDWHSNSSWRWKKHIKYSPRPPLALISIFQATPSLGVAACLWPPKPFASILVFLTIFAIFAILKNGVSGIFYFHRWSLMTPGSLHHLEKTSASKLVQKTTSCIKKTNEKLSFLLFFVKITGK